MDRVRTIPKRACEISRKRERKKKGTESNKFINGSSGMKKQIVKQNVLRPYIDKSFAVNRDVYFMRK